MLFNHKIPKPIRLDSALTKFNFVTSRAKASKLIAAGKVSIAGNVITKPATKVVDFQKIQITKNSIEKEWVSRGAQKLLGFLSEIRTACNFEITDKICLDAGASTGGFTEVLLRFGAKQIFAIDVGHNQLASCLKKDNRVVLKEGFNIRYLTPEILTTKVDIVVADISFISLTRVLYQLVACCNLNAYLILLIKPQFELETKTGLNKQGVVTDKNLQYQAVLKVIKYAIELNLEVKIIKKSCISGQKDNREFFVLLQKVNFTNVSEALDFTKDLKQEIFR